MKLALYARTFDLLLMLLMPIMLRIMPTNWCKPIQFL